MGKLTDEEYLKKLEERVEELEHIHGEIAEVATAHSERLTALLMALQMYGECDDIAEAIGDIVKQFIKNFEPIMVNPRWKLMSTGEDND